MPYNTTAIVPTEEITGAAVLPLARVKKTINADEDIGNVSAQAAFVICKATELFVQYAAERSYDIAKSEAKPKRSLTYGHVANAVARTDNLEFLSDIAPQTTTWRVHKDRTAQANANAARKSRASNASVLDPKQTTLAGIAGTSTAGEPSVTNEKSNGDLRVEMDQMEAILDGLPGPALPRMNGEKKDGEGDVEMR